jgi:Zn-dependent metalloprotease
MYRDLEQRWFKWLRAAGERKYPRRNPLHCIVPPHIYSAILLNSSNTQHRARALNSLNLSTSFQTARIGNDEANRQSREILRGTRADIGKPAWQLTGTGNLQRTIYSSHNTQKLPGNQVRAEGEPPTGDQAVDEAYTYMGSTFDFYWNVYGRNSIDDSGAPLTGSVHFSHDYDNAFWNGTQMIYGDGDGVQFTRFTVSPDVIGHELTHGVTQNESNLIYWKQAGAMNESISDVFGSLVKQYYYNQSVTQADWLIGYGLFIPGSTKTGLNGVLAIRSLAAPGTAYGYPVPDPVLGTDPQPATMTQYVDTLQDNGGVHINSGIPNRAFYLAASQVGGYAWQKMGLIWYQTCLDGRLKRTAQFQDFASLTVSVTQNLFPGVNTSELNAVRYGWSSVGINV